MRRQARVFQGFSLSLTVESEARSVKIFRRPFLPADRCQMPLTKTFFSPSFGMLADKFGVGLDGLGSAEGLNLIDHGPNRIHKPQTNWKSMHKEILYRYRGRRIVCFLSSWNARRTYRVVRSATIPAAPAVVFDHVNDLHKWDACRRGEARSRQ